MKNSLFLILLLPLGSLYCMQQNQLSKPVKNMNQSEASKQLCTQENFTVTIPKRTNVSCLLSPSQYMALVLRGALTVMGFKPGYRSPVTHSHN